MLATGASGIGDEGVEAERHTGKTSDRDARPSLCVRFRSGRGSRDSDQEGQGARVRGELHDCGWIGSV